jgi:hypothetical protein
MPLSIDALLWSLPCGNFDEHGITQSMDEFMNKGLSLYAVRAPTLACLWVFRGKQVTEGPLALRMRLLYGSPQLSDILNSHSLHESRDEKEILRSLDF